jgi:hypothetical protein
MQYLLFCCIGGQTPCPHPSSLVSLCMSRQHCKNATSIPSAMQPPVRTSRNFPLSLSLSPLPGPSIETLLPHTTPHHTTPTCCSTSASVPPPCFPPLPPQLTQYLHVSMNGWMGCNAKYARHPPLIHKRRRPHSFVTTIHHQRHFGVFLSESAGGRW